MNEKGKRNKRFLLVSLTFLITLIFLNVWSSFNNNNIGKGNKTTSKETISDVLNPKSSAYWELEYIYINNNWSSAVGEGWAEGDGTWGTPYIIENVTINATRTHNCILIENTREYFLLRNCTLFNSTLGSDRAGIKLNNVSNGVISDNKISGSYYGIWANTTSNITISYNHIRGNSKDGVYLKGSNTIIMKHNLIKENDENGIYLADSDNNEISDLNIIEKNSLYGIWLDGQSDNNEVTSNYLGYNEEGCVNDEGKSNIFENNDCVGDYEEELNYGKITEDDILAEIMIYIILIPIIVVALIGVKIIYNRYKKKGLASDKDIKADKDSISSDKK